MVLSLLLLEFKMVPSGALHKAIRHTGRFRIFLVRREDWFGVVLGLLKGARLW